MDHVDWILKQWQRERPDLDCRPMGIFGRLARLQQLSSKAIAAGYKAYKLNDAEFDLLATLRRAGPAYTLTPTQLYTSSMLSSGAMTNRIDRLEKRGLVERQPDPNDRRSLKVRLTAAGRQLIDAAIEAHVANEQRLLAALNEAGQEQLANQLKILLKVLEQAAENDPPA